MLKIPEKNKRLLLHTCCAPCSASIILDLKEADVDFTVFFYNPNIFPKKEYETRREELIRYCKKMSVPVIIAESEKNKKEWEETVRGYEALPERGERCRRCIDHRLGKTAHYARKNGFDLMATTLSVSRWKDSFMIDTCGKAVTEDIDSVDYWAQNWRAGNREERSKKIAKEEGLYCQKYCGCFYSIGDNVQ